MSYRDWGHGEDGPRGRRSVARRDESAEPPVAPYAFGTGDHRTSSRRRAVERGQPEPVDTYLPRWALESGVHRADGGGRHAAPDDDDRYEPDDPRSPEDRRATETTSSWRHATETSWRETPAVGAASDSDHTREWTFDHPQEQGYVGSRRAEDDPVSDAGPRSRPRRAASRPPQVVWSGLEETETSAESEPTRSEWPGRRRQAATPSPAVDPWDRDAGRAAGREESAHRPAVDPWDASGVHAWQPADEVGRWGRAKTPGRWDQADDTGQWRQPDSTGQWNRNAEPQWNRTDTPRPDSGTREQSWSTRGDRDEAFWSGTRLAGDDPRWVDPPPSAPRSPVVASSATRPRTASRRGTDDPPPIASAATAPVRRRIETVDSGLWSRRIEDDLLDPNPGGPLRPLLYTAACYLLPALVIFVWLLTLDGTAPAGCVTDISGGGCDSPRSRALGSLVEAMPRFGLALASSLVVALLLRQVGTTWRAATVALAAAVVGGGLSTVMISAVTGQPIG
ncbi:hypothetical protein QTQ03_19845 [Micromonospora sp. WMMA1363]|uniref:hypothetical protein n=1 Tax=Micromonospora sp. WMMA1363 TaxID=3053985 RepID=UPI00259D146E|nr:hypothetical protein [Micromonospora sp. WMMA1363]MDM4721733.1 hypothetical protein [Micromonospora sp. WMMA1363]